MEIKVWTARVLYDYEWHELGYFTSEELVQQSLNNLRSLDPEDPQYYLNRIYEDVKPTQITLYIDDKPYFVREQHNEML